MSDRYTRLATLPENLYLDGSPVLIAAAALLKDNKTGAVLAQIKLQNLYHASLTACQVHIKTYDPGGTELHGVDGYSYLDLRVGQGEYFGAKEAIVLPDSTARKISVSVTQIVYGDGNVWKHEPAEWQTPELKKIKIEEFAPDPEIQKQYSLEIGNDECNYVPEESGSLVLCPCGTLNLSGYDKCYNCGIDLKNALTAMNLDMLTMKMNERIAAEENERIRYEKDKEEQRIERKRKEEELREKEQRIEEELRASGEKAKREKQKRIKLATIAGVIVAAVVIVVLVTIHYISWNNERKVENITLSSHNVEILTSDTLELSALLSPANLEDITLSWNCSNPDVFNVSGPEQSSDAGISALITAVAPGSAELTVTTKNGKSDSCSITVRDPIVPVAVTLDKVKLSLIIGDNQDLAAKISPGNADNQTIIWESSDPTVASVSGSTVTAISAGKAVVTATTFNGLKAECEVAVREFISVSSVNAGEDHVLTIGESVTLCPKVLPDNADDKRITVTSSNEDIITVSGTTLTAVAPGTGKVIVTASNGVSDEVKIKVQTLEETQEQQYSQLVRKVNAESYSDAVRFYSESKLTIEYKDVSDYYNYAQAMILYKQTQLLNMDDLKNVISTLDSISSGFKDAAEISRELTSSLNYIIGTHCCIEWPNLASVGVDDSKFLVVNEEGSAVLDYGMSYKGKPNSDYAMYVLAYANLEKDSIFVLIQGSRLDFDKVAYGITIISSRNEIALSSAWGDRFGTWRGNYKKVG